VCNKPQGYFCPISNINPPYCTGTIQGSLCHRGRGILNFLALYPLKIEVAWFEKAVSGGKALSGELWA
jgi:hypothetical protein